jgi:hypothetical protein
MLPRHVLSAIPVILDLKMGAMNNVRMDIGETVKIISANVIFLLI